MSTAGSVTLIYGSPTGLRRTGSRAITQKTSHVPQGRPTEQAMLGTSVGSADVVGGPGPSFDELIVTMNFGLDGRSGDPYSAVLVALGAASGLTTRNCQVWTSKKLGHHVSGDDLGFGEPILG